METNPQLQRGKLTLQSKVVAASPYAAGKAQGEMLSESYANF